MSEKLLRSLSELDTPYLPYAQLGVPGKVATTSRLPGRPIYRLADAAAANGERDANGVAASADVAVDRAATSSGHALPEDLRGRFESSLGADLSGVRVHTGADSAQAASAVGAKAYTTGQDIHFAEGNYNPGDAFGVHLLAHEVAHTVQQRGAPAARQNKLEVSGPADSAEVEADRAADAMVAGAPANVGGSAMVLARDAAPPADAPARDSKKASFAKKTVGISLFGKQGTVTASEDGCSADLTLGEIDFGTAEKNISQDWPFQAAAAPGGMIIRLEGGIKASATGSLAISGGLRDFGSGAREDENNTMGFTGTLSTTGSVTFEASGKLSVLGYVGAPFANLNAGGYVKLSGSITGAITTSGTLEISPDGVAQGNVKSSYGADLSVVGSGGLTVGYVALIKKDTLYEVELVSHEFATGKLGQETTHDFGSGATTSADTSQPLVYKPIVFSQPKTREMEKKENRDAAEVEDDQNDGASGGGGGIAPENYDPEETGEAPGTCSDESSSCAPAEANESNPDQEPS